MAKEIEKKKIDVTPAALFMQILAILFPEYSDLEVMPIDKMQGKFLWLGKKIDVNAYRIFSRAKGHPTDMVRVDLKLVE